MSFQSCLHKELGLSVFVIIAYDLAFDSDSTFLEVDRIPLQTEDLTSSQTVISCDVYDKFQFVPFEYLKQFIQLVYIVKDGFMSLCSRHDHLVHRVLCQHFHFYCIGESRMQSKVILLDRTALNTLVHFMIEISLDIALRKTA